MTTLPSSLPCPVSPAEALVLIRAYNDALFQIATNTPRLDEKVRAYIAEHRDLLSPLVPEYSASSPEAQKLIACKQTLFYLLTGAPKIETWLKENGWKAQIESPHLTPEESLLVFNLQGRTRASNWLTQREPDLSFLGEHWISNPDNQQQIIIYTLRQLASMPDSALPALIHDIKDDDQRLAIKTLMKDIAPECSMIPERTPTSLSTVVSGWFKSPPSSELPPTGERTELLSLVLEFIKKASLEQCLADHAQVLYKALPTITNPLREAITTHQSSIYAFTLLPKMPVVPGTKDPVIAAFDIYLSTLSQIKLLPGTPDEISCDFIKHALAHTMGCSVTLLPEYLAANIGKKLPGGKLVSEQFYDTINSLVEQLETTFKATGVEGVRHFIAPFCPVAVAPVEAPSPKVATLREAVRLYQAKDRDGFMAFLDTIPGFKTPVLYQLWELGGKPEGDPEWSVNHWHDNNQSMFQALNTAYDAIHSHTA